MSAWAVVLAASLRAPVDLGARLDAVHRHVPLVGARLVDGRWAEGDAPLPRVVGDDPIDHADSIAKFDLRHESPLRVLTDEHGLRVVLVGHHAAFDGLGLVGVLSLLMGGDPPVTAAAHRPGTASPPWSALRRLAYPAHVVAPSPGRQTETLLARPVRVAGPSVTARLAAAGVAAAADHNRRRGAAWHRIGISVGMGGPPGIGNVATYRRIDVGPDTPVVRAVIAALTSDADPFELHHVPTVPRFARALVLRLSDSLLVSNLGRHRLDGVAALEFFPVARGRSGLAIGAVGLEGGASTLSLRALRLSPADAEALLAATIRRFDETRGTLPQ